MKPENVDTNIGSRSATRTIAAKPALAPEPEPNRIREHPGLGAREAGTEPSIYERMRRDAPVIQAALLTKVPFREFMELAEKEVVRTSAGQLPRAQKRIENSTLRSYVYRALMKPEQFPPLLETLKKSTIWQQKSHDVTIDYNGEFAEVKFATTTTFGRGYKRVEEIAARIGRFMQLVAENKVPPAYAFSLVNRTSLHVPGESEIIPVYRFENGNRRVTHRRPTARSQRPDPGYEEIGTVLRRGGEEEIDRIYL